MKKLLLTLLVVGTGVGAFAQGKLNVVNDSLHLLYFGNVLKAADTASAGQLVTASPTPSGATLVVDLYGGPDANSMTLQTTAIMNPTLPGIFGPMGFTSPNLPGDVVATMQVKVRESGFATAEAAQSGGGYYGYSSIFTLTLSSGISRPTLVNHESPWFSTWADGTFDLGAAGFGVVMVEAIPEPSSLCLIGLGIIALRTPRRHK